MLPGSRGLGAGIRAASITGGFAPDSPYTSTTLADLMERDLLPRFAHHPELEVEIAGEVVQSRKATGDLAAVFVLSVIGIACVIAIMLGSFLEAAFVVAVVPFAAAAVFLTFFLHGMHFSLLAVIGMIGLAGVVVNSAIVMLDSVHRAQASLRGVDELTRTNGIIDALVERHERTSRVDLNDIAEVIDGRAVGYEEIEQVIVELEARGCNVGGPPTAREMVLLGRVVESARSLSIVRAVIGLAHGLNVPVLAEGVETNEQLAILMRERCDDMQGYLIGRPHRPELYAEHMKPSPGALLKTAS